MEFRGVDLAADLDSKAVFVIIGAFRRHHVMLFRRQGISSERQFEIAEQFGA